MNQTQTDRKIERLRDSLAELDLMLFTSKREAYGRAYKMFEVIHTVEDVFEQFVFNSPRYILGDSNTYLCFGENQTLHLSENASKEVRGAWRLLWRLRADVVNALVDLVCIDDWGAGFSMYERRRWRRHQMGTYREMMSSLKPYPEADDAWDMNGVEAEIELIYQQNRRSLSEIKSIELAKDNDPSREVGAIIVREAYNTALRETHHEMLRAREAWYLLFDY